MDSHGYSVGVEEEYQLVEPRTGELRSRARDVLETDWGDELYAEIQETMLEVGTRICRTSAELEDEVRRLRLHVGSAAAAHDLTIVAAGLHPFSRWQGQSATADERYARILARFGRVMRTEHVFGMHVHVAVPDGTDRIALVGGLRVHLPLLLALSGSSPFYEGEDTGYASYRTILVRRLPHSGIPPRFASEAEYDRYVRLLREMRALEDVGALYWSLRPHPRYPTLEFRVTDVCPRVDDAVAIAALARTLVAAAAEGGLPPLGAELSASAEDALLDTAEWQAARYGLDAVLPVPFRGGTRMPARDAVRRLIEELEPFARAIGEESGLQAVERLLERGSAAERMRDIVRAGGSLPDLVSWLAGESQLGVGLDRRAAQRREAGGG